MLPSQDTRGGAMVRCTWPRGPIGARNFLYVENQLLRTGEVTIKGNKGAIKSSKKELRNIHSSIIITL